MARKRLSLKDLDGASAVGSAAGTVWQQGSQPSPALIASPVGAVMLHAPAIRHLPAADPTQELPNLGEHAAVGSARPSHP
jgi:hypothetical protein